MTYCSMAFEIVIKVFSLQNEKHTLSQKMYFGHPFINAWDFCRVFVFDNSQEEYKDN